MYITLFTIRALLDSNGELNLRVYFLLGVSDPLNAYECTNPDSGVTHVSPISRCVTRFL